VRNGKVTIAPTTTEDVVLERHTSRREDDIEQHSAIEKGESKDWLPTEKESPSDSKELDTGELRRAGELIRDVAEGDREAEDSDDSVKMNKS